MTALGCAGNGAAPISSTAGITPSLDLIEQEGKIAFVVDGLVANSQEEQGASQFTVRVDRESDTSAMVGKYHREGSRLVFSPRFRLTPGLRYRAIYQSSDGSAAIERSFSIPRPERPSSTGLSQVYPSRNELPENLLRIYLEFSAAMSQGNSYEHIRLVHSGGETVELPFLELPEELWDRDGRRLTLLFDPGRIKRGLKPQREVGSPLIAGERYRLIIDSGWKDAAGARLLAGHEREIRVGPADRKQPDPDQWQLTSPLARTREPLTVEFDESLDHALVKRMIWVADPLGMPIECEISLGEAESRAHFTPTTAWQGGTHHLRIDIDLEDLAGNSIRWVFDRKMDDHGKTEAARDETISLPFSISAIQR